MSEPDAHAPSDLRRIRFLIGAFIAGLVVSGLTAFPLLQELELLDTFVRKHTDLPTLTTWIERVHHGLRETYARYPFIGYGTDWLAFGHLVIALFFIGALRDPVRNVWLLHAGQIACVLVIPTALICGAVREIPLWWRMIDCSFGVIGFFPLWLAARLVRQLESR